MHGGTPDSIVSIRYRPWPAPINGHRVMLEEDLSEGVFYFYCTECSSGGGLGQGKVCRATDDERARMKKYIMGTFMMDECDGEEGPEQANTNINVSPGGNSHSIAVEVSGGDLGAPTKKAIVDSIRNNKAGQLATRQNRNNI
jgi:hypothetical protein